MPCLGSLRERTQVEQLLRYIVEEPPTDAEKRRIFKFPFIACEIFTCEVDVILKTLIEDEELMHILFSFLEPDRSHNTLISGYFSKVVICLMLRKTVPFMNFIQGHKEIIRKMVDLIGITSIMEVLVRLVGADDHIYTNYMDAMQWLDDTDVLEIIVDKLSSSVSIIMDFILLILRRCMLMQQKHYVLSCDTPLHHWLQKLPAQGNFVGRLFNHALDSSRPKSVLVHSLSVCIALLDPKRMVSTPSYSSRGNLAFGSSTIASPETVVGMLEKLGDLLQLLNVSNSQVVLPTTYGKLQPPLGKHRLKIVEFISVLLTAGSEAAEKELVQLGALQRVLDLFFEYPFNNFLHHHVENIIVSCLESKKVIFIEHLFQDCDLIGKILAAEKSFTLSTASDKPTSAASGRSPPKIGNIGHLTRIANKLIQLGNTNGQISAYLQEPCSIHLVIYVSATKLAVDVVSQNEYSALGLGIGSAWPDKSRENNDWADWQSSILVKRNALENIYQWACGRPTTLQERTRDSDDDDFRDRDFDVAALASNLSQAFRYGIYCNDDIEEAHGSLERDDEDVYFDEESAEVVISSLRLGDDQDSGSLFTNSNWFAFEDDRVANDRISDSFATASPSAEDDEVVVGEDDLSNTTALTEDTEEKSLQPVPGVSDNGMHVEVNDTRPATASEGEKPPEWVEWRESSGLGSSSGSNFKPAASVNGDPKVGGSVPFSTDEANSGMPSTAGIANSTVALPVLGGENLRLDDPSASMFEDVELVGKEETADSMELDKNIGVGHSAPAAS
ncbi:Serine/threonine-protein phosphatase 6 regulatory subunit 2 [Nymphaea thermarum]|nr:Serine/threonine-protein phosphatase 6 regulatory subunit 2 [Nymphaea thermarum]